MARRISIRSVCMRDRAERLPPFSPDVNVQLTMAIIVGSWTKSTPGGEMLQSADQTWRFRNTRRLISGQIRAGRTPDPCRCRRRRDRGHAVLRFCEPDACRKRRAGGQCILHQTTTRDAVLEASARPMRQGLCPVRKIPKDVLRCLWYDKCGHPKIRPPIQKP